MPELIDKQKAQTEIALIAKYLAKSDAQKAIIGRILFMLDKMKAIEPEVRHGRWISQKGDNKETVDGWICTSCKSGFHTKVPYFKAFKYCPMCGARMDLRTPTEVQLDEADSVMMGGADNG